MRAAFPELALYLAAREERPGADGDGDGRKSEAHAGPLRSRLSSGLSSDIEYRRTIGALFAFYWLMRIGIDGERGFSFGVDHDWAPLDMPAVQEGERAEGEGGVQPVQRPAQFSNLHNASILLINDAGFSCLNLSQVRLHLINDGEF